MNSMWQWPRASVHGSGLSSIVRHAHACAVRRVKGKLPTCYQRTLSINQPFTGGLGVPAWGGPLQYGWVLVRRQPPLPAPTPPEGGSNGCGPTPAAP